MTWEDSVSTNPQMLLGNLLEDAMPDYEPFNINRLEKCVLPIWSEHGLSSKDMLHYLNTQSGAPDEFIETELHAKFTSLYNVDHYVDGSIPSTMTVNYPYFPRKYVGDHQPFFIQPEFYVSRIFPSMMTGEPNLVHQMHFRDHSAYVESNFLFLQNLLRRTHNYYFAYHYYGSFNGIQRTFRHSITPSEIESLVRHRSSFLLNLRKSFFFQNPLEVACLTDDDFSMTEEEEDLLVSALEKLELSLGNSPYEMWKEIKGRLVKADAAETWFPLAPHAMGKLKQHQPPGTCRFCSNTFCRDVWILRRTDLQQEIEISDLRIHLQTCYKQLIYSK